MPTMFRYGNPFWSHVGFNSSSQWFVDCDDLPQLQRLGSVHRPLHEAVEKAQLALQAYTDWKSHHKRTFTSKAVLGAKKDHEKQALESSHYGFLTARLYLAATFNPLFSATRAMQSLLKEFLQNNTEREIELAVRVHRDDDANKPELKHYHLEIYRMNMKYCTLLLAHAYKLLAREEYEDRNMREDQNPGTFKDLIGPAAVLAILPELPNPTWGNTLKGVLTWFGKLLEGKTKMPWGSGKGMGGFPEATSIAFTKAGWNVERVEGPFEETGEPGDRDSRTHYILTAPQADSNKKAD